MCKISFLVLLLGVTYRGDVGDTRYSPVEYFYELLKMSGCEVRAHDYFIEHWTECDVAVETKLETALAQEYDVIALTTGHSEYRNNAMLLASLSRMPKCMVYDTIGLLSEAELAEIARVHEVRVLGRGAETIKMIES